jgi:hypothetical protein
LAPGFRNTFVCLPTGIGNIAGVVVIAPIVYPLVLVSENAAQGALLVASGIGGVATGTPFGPIGDLLPELPCRMPS